MNVPGKEKCQRCGAVIPSPSTGEPCAACLLSGALAQTTDDPAETLTAAPAGPLSLHGPSKFPCEFGGYRLLGLLGRGGMGAVYEAEERSTGRRLALKMLGRQIDSPDMRQRFLREGRLAARVNHPNSLYIFGSEEIEGHPVITMEIAGGGTLKDRLKQRGPLPVNEAVDAILDVISGLESAFAERRAPPRRQAIQLLRFARRFGEGGRLRPLGFHAGHDRHLRHGSRPEDHGHAGLRVARTAARRRRWTCAPTSTRWARRCSRC